MKIRINENEHYDIELPSEIDLEQLTGILARLNSISRLVSKETFTEIPRVINPNKEQWKLLKENRNIFIEVMKAYYSDGIEEMNRIADKYGLTMLKNDKKPINAYGGRKLLEIHKVTPQELGLLRLPTRGEKLEKLQIKEAKEEMKEAIAEHLDIKRREKKDYTFMKDRANVIEVFKTFYTKPFEELDNLMKNKFGLKDFKRIDIKNLNRFRLLHNIKDEEVKQ